MLSYQHGYHAGNAADVHKHALLARALAHLSAKDKPLTYIETHAGRGLYDLAGEQAIKTGEARAGILRLDRRFPADHPYAQVLAQLRAAHGASAYPGSPLIAHQMLRPMDRLWLAERHPAEHAALAALMPPRVQVRFEDGFTMAQSLTPPDPRRGLMLIDPSFETAQDYERMPGFIGQIARKWNVGVIALWYPILAQPRHGALTQALMRAHPSALRSEVRFPPARPGHGMVGSGMIWLNPPHVLQAEAAFLETLFT